MKIAVLISGLDDYQGTNLQALSHATAFAKAGHSVTLFTFNSEGESCGIPIRSLQRCLCLPVWAKPWRNFLYFFPLRRLLIRQNLEELRDFDVLMVYDYIMSWLGHYAKRTHDTTYVQFIDGVVKECPLLSEKLYFWVVNRWFWKVPFTNTDFVITETRFLARLLKEQMGVESIPVGSLIDLSLFSPGISGKEIRDLYHFDSDPLILYVDYLDPGHRVDILLRSFEIVRKVIPRAKLMLVGKCRYKSYGKYIHKLADESTFFIDYVPHTEIPKFYAASTVFATCCTWEEAYSHTIVEAEACGKPVVAFKQGAHEEVVKNGETGILVDQVGDAQAFASALITLLTNQNLASDMGQKAAQWARYLADEGTREVQELLQRIETLAE